MARADRKKKGGRTTPRGSAPPESGRYTAPIPPELKISPTWVPVLMFTLLALGGLVIFLNYLGLLPGATDNRYLLLGLGFVLGGIVTSTQFH